MDQQYQDSVKQIISSVLDNISKPESYEFLREGDQWRINIVSKTPDDVYGHKGSLINSIQHLVRVITHKTYPDDRTHFLIDVNMMRKNREKYVNEEVPKMAQDDVLTLGKTVVINGLSSYERKIVHAMLVDVQGLGTTSVGKGNERKLLIRPDSDTGSLGMENSKVVDINQVKF